jgi:L-malate glycosyltransferase
MMRSTAAGTPGVLHVVLSLAPGGTERLVVEMVRSLRHRHRTSVCCLDEAGVWGEALRAEGTSVHVLGRQPGFQPALAKRIAAVAASQHATVLHCHQYTPFVYGCLARVFNPQLRVIFTEHGRVHDGPPSRKRRAANTLLSRLPARVFAVSEDLRQHMIAEGFASSAIDVVVNGIADNVVRGDGARAQARLRLGLSHDVFAVGSVGRLDPVKDLRTLLAAYEQFARERPRTRLLVIGDGPERAALEQQARALRAPVDFLGHRPDVQELMPAFDVLVNSSVFEGVSLTLLEAMAAERPVLATRVGGTPQVVVDDVTGLLVAPRDASALAAGLESIATRPWAARVMGIAGRRRVLEQFSLARMVETYSMVYSELQGHSSCAA